MSVTIAARLSAHMEYAEFEGLGAAAARSHFRAGAYRGHTAGIAPGMLQGNVVILGKDDALDFFAFAQRNPKPCPLIGVSDAGNPMLPTLGDDIDIRTDVPMYRVFENGELIDETTDIAHLWRDDFVAFVIGCSFTFEQALINEGIRLRHIEENKTVGMFVTDIETTPAGPFSGGMVVSMRPMKMDDAIRATAICSRFPHAHGAPVHMGDPAAIGIKDIGTPDWGDPTDFRDGEIPVFWACGVTPQNAVREARPSICITHAPGCMLVTDVPGWATDSKISTTNQKGDYTT